MTKEFEKRVIKEGIVDTRNYRYTWKGAFYGNGHGYRVIKRIPLTMLGTTAVLDQREWKTVKTTDF